MNLISFGVFGIIFLTILAMVSNSSEESQENIQNKMFLMNCPLPSYDGLWNTTNVSLGNPVGFVVILNNSAGVSYGGQGSVFRCSIATLTPFPAFQVIISNKNYTQTTLGFPSGWFTFAGDFIGSAFQRVNALFELIGLFISPTGFNILGYGLADLSGIALMFVIAIYAFCYIAIGILLYKVISPFSGVGS